MLVEECRLVFFPVGAGFLGLPLSLGRGACGEDVPRLPLLPAEAQVGLAFDENQLNRAAGAIGITGFGGCLAEGVRNLAYTRPIVVPLYTLVAGKFFLLFVVYTLCLEALFFTTRGVMAGGSMGKIRTYMKRHRG